MHVLFLLLSALLTSPALARDRITIAIVGVHQDLLMNDAQYSASEQFSDTIKGLGKLDPLGPRDMAWLIQGREEVILQDAFSTCRQVKHQVSLETSNGIEHLYGRLIFLCLIL